jgi:hypothetical protein
LKPLSDLPDSTKSSWCPHAQFQFEGRIWKAAAAITLVFENN